MNSSPSEGQNAVHVIRLMFSCPTVILSGGRIRVDTVAGDIRDVELTVCHE